MEDGSSSNLCSSHLNSKKIVGVCVDGIDIIFIDGKTAREK